MRTWPNNAANRLKIGGNPSRLDFPGNGENFTLACWIKLVSNGGDQTFLSKYNGFGPLFRLVGTGLKCFWLDAGAGGHEASGATPVTTGVLHHVAMRWDSSVGMDGFLDGAVDASDHSTLTMHASSDVTDGWTFGARSSPSNPLDGDMGEVAMWNVALSPAEIAALARGVSPLLVAARNLKGYWPTFGDFDSGADYTDGSNNLALVGTLATASHAPVGPQVPLARGATRAGAGAASAPANTVAPVAETWPEAGRLIVTGDGTWTGSPAPTFEYQWQVSDNGSTGWADITGATSAVYRVAAAYLGKYLRCVVTATNTEGSADANSNVIGPVTAAPTGGYASVAVS